MARWGRTNADTRPRSRPSRTAVAATTAVSGRRVWRPPASARMSVIAVLVASVLALVTGTAGPAGAHARVTGSSPAAGDVLATPPAEVSLHLDAKPATAEGDPLVLVGPDGRRVATGPAEVAAGGRALTVTVTPGRSLPAGDYQLVYRVVSEDTHVVMGRLTFTALRPGLPAAPGASAGRAAGVRRLGAAWDAPADGATGSPLTARRLAPGGPDDPGPRVAAAAVAAVALAALAWRRLTRRPSGRPTRGPSRPAAARGAPDRRTGRAPAVGPAGRRGDRRVRGAAPTVARSGGPPRPRTPAPPPRTRRVSAGGHAPPGVAAGGARPGGPRPGGRSAGSPSRWGAPAGRPAAGRPAAGHGTRRPAAPVRGGERSRR